MKQTALGMALEKADVTYDELYIMATTAMKNARNNESRAFEIFYRELKKPAREYFDLAIKDMNSAGGGHRSGDIHSRVAPAAPKPNGGGGGHVSYDTHMPTAPTPSAERDGDKGRLLSDTHRKGAQPSQPSRDGAGHLQRDTQAINARPAREPNAIERKAALKAAPTIFDKQVGGAKRKLGRLTKFDVRQVKRRSLIDGHIADRLISEVEWPDDDKTPLAECASKQQVEGIFKSAYAVLDSMGVTNAAR